VLKRPRQWFLSWARWIQSISSQSLSIRPTLILSSHLRPCHESGVFLSGVFSELYYLFDEALSGYQPCQMVERWKNQRFEYRDDHRTQLPGKQQISLHYLFFPILLKVNNCAFLSFICHQILLVWSNQVEWNGRINLHPWEGWKMHKNIVVGEPEGKWPHIRPRSR